MTKATNEQECIYKAPICIEEVVSNYQSFVDRPIEAQPFGMSLVGNKSECLNVCQAFPTSYYTWTNVIPFSFFLLF